MIKNNVTKKMVIMLLIIILISYIFTTFSNAASKYIYYNGFRLDERYMENGVEYWVTDILTWKTSEIKVPDVANNIDITAIYDNTTSTGVFQGNIWLEKVDLSESKIELIGSRCFYNCSNLKTFITSPVLTSISAFAFQNANLTSLTLNEGLNLINISAFEDAFSDENGLYVIDIPDSVTDIRENAFKVTNKNYRVVLVGEKGSAAEEYCETDSNCSFVKRGDKIPTEEELIQAEIEKEKKKLFVNTDFTYQGYNNTDTANKTISFVFPVTSLNSSNLETFSDIIVVEDGFIVVGTSYLDKYRLDSTYYKELMAGKAKGNDDAIIVKYNFDLGMEWFQSFGGSLGDQFHNIYKTTDGGYLVFGVTCSHNGDLQNINYDTASYNDMVVKYNSDFEVVETKMIDHTDAYQEYKDEILEDGKGDISNGRISLNTISDGKLGVVHGTNGQEMNTLIQKYDDDNHLEWEKTFDRNSSKTDDRLTKVVEVEDGYVFIGSSSQTIRNSYGQDILVEKAIIVKYNKPYDKIMINGLLFYDMNVGEQKTVDLLYVPWEDVTIGEMEWTSENEEVATVDYKGNILAKGEGSTTINLNIRGKTAQVFVEVTDLSLKHITKIELDKTELSLKEEETETLVATITPMDTTDDTKITWSSDDETVATVDEEGKITAISEGTAIITAKTVNGKIATCTVTVEKEMLKGDVNGDDKVSLYDAFQILRTVILGDGSFTEDEKYVMDFNGDGNIGLYDAFQFLRQVILS